MYDDGVALESNAALIKRSIGQAAVYSTINLAKLGLHLNHASRWNPWERMHTICACTGPPAHALREAFFVVV